MASKTTKLESIHLARKISELEDDVESVWEPPEIYNDVLGDNVWLIYGRKGSGKSHLVDFLRADERRLLKQESVFVIRPRQNRLFQLVMSSIGDATYDDERIIIENLVAALEFVVTSLVMKKAVNVDGFLAPSSNREKIYTFLTSNDLIKGSIARKSINFLSKVAGGEFKLVSNLAQLLDNEDTSKGYAEAKTALWETLQDAHGKFIISIDDIDEIGFSYSYADRLFVNALIVMMLRLNMEFSENNFPIRILLTSPSELFFHSSLWGDDWVETQSKCLRWVHHEMMHKIVNKRIGKELNVRKNNPSTEFDIYSDSTRDTWEKIFPRSVNNCLNKNESALKYILRHTFYTPRHVLKVCDNIIHCMGKRGYTLETIGDASQYEWNAVFQEKVEEYTYGIDRSFRKLYGKIYDGLDEVMNAFQSRPTIWSNASICDFLDKKDLKLVKKESGKEYVGDALIYRLQQLGFLGLGTKSYVGTPLVESFNVRFSYLEKLPIQKPWEIAVISPIFYDAYGIKPIGDIPIVPHESLRLKTAAWQEVLRYKAL